MNWGTWVQGMVVALVSGALTVLTAIAVLPACPTGWQLFLIAGVPFLTTILSYVKQTPPPIGVKKKGGDCNGKSNP
jgi:hypothetical protein